MAGVNAYKDGVVGRLYKGLQGLLKQPNITLVQGAGKLVSPDTVEVSGRRYTGRNVILATGSYSRSLPGLEIDGKRVLASEHALRLDRVPSSAIVLGGGVIGVEFASVWKSFGADVTILEALPRLVAAEDEEISKAVERAFRKRKINFKVGKPFEKVEYTEGGVKAYLAGGETVEAEILLVAVGRGPTTKDLGYEQQGITLDRGFVITNERLHTGVGNIYAVGDIVPGVQLAHRGFQQGIFVAEEIAGNKPAVIEDINVPKVTYCDPEIASVGLNQPQAEEKYGKDNVETVEYNLAGNGKSSILGTSGIIKMVREKDGPIVGMHMIGGRIGEQIGEAQLIVSWEAYPEDVAALIHAHPTQNEALGEAAMALAGRPLHG
jgi:dihydrolipoamide dehydrogenase